MTSSSASDHGIPAGIAALMQKGTTSKGMEANKNFAKCLSCGIQISGTFGLHHVMNISEFDSKKLETACFNMFADSKFRINSSKM
jgi:hypothetical protein